jgi:hypothetical protein
MCELQSAFAGANSSPGSATWLPICRTGRGIRFRLINEVVQGKSDQELHTSQHRQLPRRVQIDNPGVHGFGQSAGYEEAGEHPEGSQQV